MNDKEKKQLSPATIDKYQNILKKFNIKKINLDDINQVIKEINNYVTNSSTVKAYLSAFLWYITNNNLKINIDIYKEKIYSLGAKISKERGKNRFTEKEKQNSLTLQELKKIKDDIKIRLEKNNFTNKSLFKFFIILSLYIDFPPRRLKDYVLMYYYFKKPSILSNEKNYLILSNKGGYFIFNSYKTSKNYKTQKFIISKNLQYELRNYIKINGINSEDSLLNVSVTALHHFIKYYMKKEANIEASCNMIRHCFATFVNDKGNKYNFNTKKSIAAKMAHSIFEQGEYPKYKDAIKN